MDFIKRDLSFGVFCLLMERQTLHLCLKIAVPGSSRKKGVIVGAILHAVEGRNTASHLLTSFSCVMYSFCFLNFGDQFILIQDLHVTILEMFFCSYFMSFVYYLHLLLVCY